MNKKRILSVLLAGMFSVLLLSGCSGDSSTRTSTSETTKTEAGSAADESKDEDKTADTTAAQQDDTDDGEDPDAAAKAKADQEIEIWCWDTGDSRKLMHAAFTDDTGIYANLTAVESKDMTQKLQTTLASGGQMPDVAWCEATFRGKLLSLDIWEDMTAEPYNFDKSNVLDYLIDLETSEDGRWVGPECPSVAGMAFKRDLALEYLGTDDPAEIEAMFPTWDAFLEKAVEVQEKSGGEVFMMPSLGSAGIIFKGQGTEPFIDGDKLNLDVSMKPILEMVLKFKAAGATDILDFDSPEEGASYADNKHIFYPCANWSVEYTIKSNDKDGQGRWGFFIPPSGPFPWGGTVLAVPKGAKNPAGGVEYIKYFFASLPGAELQRDIKGNFSPYKPVYENEDFFSAEDVYFDGQNVLQEIAQRVLPEIKGVRIPSPYDQDINDVYNLIIKDINASNGDLDVDDLIAKMEDELINKNPSITK